MADFFRPSSEEKRVINRSEQIAYDTFKYENGVYRSLFIDSKANYLRIKFFLDAIEYLDPITNESVIVRVGKYFEMEQDQTVKLGIIKNKLTSTVIIEDDEKKEITSHLLNKVIEFKYECSLTTTAVSIRFTDGSTESISYYLSSVSFTDSFYSPENGWFSTTNPNNIIDKISDEYTFELDVAGGDYLPIAGGTMEGEIDMNNHKIINVSDPTNNQDAVNLRTMNQAITDASNTFVKKSGDTMTGPLLISNGSDPQIPSLALSSSLNILGEAINAENARASFKSGTVADQPQYATDITNKAYVDSLVYKPRVAYYGITLSDPDINNFHFNGPANGTTPWFQIVPVLRITRIDNTLIFDLYNSLKSFSGITSAMNTDLFIGEQETKSFTLDIDDNIFKPNTINYITPQSITFSEGKSFLVSNTVRSQFEFTVQHATVGSCSILSNTFNSIDKTLTDFLKLYNRKFIFPAYYEWDGVTVISNNTR